MVSHTGYGLINIKMVDILIEEPDRANFFEALVEEAEKLEPPCAELANACAKFVVNELLSRVNKHAIEGSWGNWSKIPPALAAELLVKRRKREITNMQIRDIIDKLYED